MKKVGLISLGCDKNRVDSEIMLANLQKGGFEITNRPEEADVLIVNTCAFLEAARKEAIDTVFELAAYNTDHRKKLILTGCLPQKYLEELYPELTEADGFFGTNDYDHIANFVHEICEKGERVAQVTKDVTTVTEGDRVLTTPGHYAYLRIADGCDNHCTYCLIPSIRGKYRSRKPESVVQEAESLVARGVKELILVAQDTTSYGTDLFGEPKLADLLVRLNGIHGLQTIRTLYCYPEKITDELIGTLAKLPKCAHYLDVPLQHVSDRVLKRMGRQTTYRDIVSLFDRLRKAMPDVSIRTTLMLGFPGETQEDVDLLCKFLQEQKLQNVGFFAFSAEPGTPAEKLKDQIPEEEKQRRVQLAIDAQSRAVDAVYAGRIGHVYPLVVDDAIEEEDEKVYVARGYWSAPEIDGVCFVHSKRELRPGGTVRAKVVANKGYDLVCVAEEDL